jgi:polyphenol oxidase
MAEYLTHPLLDLPGVRHAFFTRNGGASGGIYDSLNVGMGSSDDPADVRENRSRCAALFDAAEDHLFTAYQVHSTLIRVAEAPWGDQRPEGDGVVTDQAGLVCGALTADCAPILLADPHARIVGAVHAGWKGALNGVVHSGVAAMQAFGAIPERMVAVVGPCIGPDSYEVGADFQDRFEHHDPGSSRFFRAGAAPDKRLFDLPGFVLWRLAEAGVARTAWTGHDTCTDETRFFSNRRAYKRGEPDFGRLLSAISLTD